jgi:hypothetical protein
VLPTDLLDQAAARLRILALLYEFTFFMAAFFGRSSSVPRVRRSLRIPSSGLPGCGH